MESRVTDKLRFPRVLGPALMALCFLSIAKDVHASNNCPWINEATVSGLLDGEAVGDFSQGSAGQPSICSFVHTTSDRTRTLTITVEVTSDAQTRVNSMAKGCAQTSEILPAIGNEAYVCTTEHSKEAVVQRVIGRVRDQVFTISIGTTGKGESAVWMANMKTRIAITAEQVSGNLF
jgi:hypothetical protein